MRVSILPAGNFVSIDGRAVTLDLTAFACLAGIHAIHADTDRDRAEIEFSAIDPDGPGPLPSVKPPNEIVTAIEFYARFGSVVDAAVAMPETPPSPPMAKRPMERPRDDGAIEGLAQDIVALVHRCDQLEAMVADLQAFNADMIKEMQGVAKTDAP